MVFANSVQMPLSLATCLPLVWILLPMTVFSILYYMRQHICAFFLRHLFSIASAIIITVLSAIAYHQHNHQISLINELRSLQEDRQQKDQRHLETQKKMDRLMSLYDAMLEQGNYTQDQPLVTRLPPTPIATPPPNPELVAQLSMVASRLSTIEAKIQEKLAPIESMQGMISSKLSAHSSRLSRVEARVEASPAEEALAGVAAMETSVGVVLEYINEGYKNLQSQVYQIHGQQVKIALNAVADRPESSVAEGSEYCGRSLVDTESGIGYEEDDTVIRRNITGFSECTTEAYGSEVDYLEPTEREKLNAFWAYTGHQPDDTAFLDAEGRVDFLADDSTNSSVKPLSPTSTVGLRSIKQMEADLLGLNQDTAVSVYDEDFDFTNSFSISSGTDFDLLSSDDDSLSCNAVPLSPQPAGRNATQFYTREFDYINDNPPRTSISALLDLQSQIDNLRKTQLDVTKTVASLSIIIADDLESQPTKADTISPSELHDQITALRLDLYQLRKEQTALTLTVGTILEAVNQTDTLGHAIVQLDRRIEKLGRDGRENKAEVRGLTRQVERLEEFTFW